MHVLKDYPTMDMHLHDRAGILAGVLYKAKTPSIYSYVCHVKISVMSSWIEMGLT